MTILARNKISTYQSSSSEGSSEEIALSEAKRGDPSSNYFQYPSYLLPLDAPKLIQWLRECHYAAKLAFIEPGGRHSRQAKKLIENHGHDDLIKAIMLASQVSKHSFSFKFVEEFL